VGIASMTDMLNIPLARDSAKSTLRRFRSPFLMTAWCRTIR
jgi:hypothetical protein